MMHNYVSIKNKVIMITIINKKNNNNQEAMRHRGRTR